MFIQVPFKVEHGDLAIGLSNLLCSDPSWAPVLGRMTHKTMNSAAVSRGLDMSSPEPVKAEKVNRVKKIHRVKIIEPRKTSQTPTLKNLILTYCGGRKVTTDKVVDLLSKAGYAVKTQSISAILSVMCNQDKHIKCLLSPDRGPYVYQIPVHVSQPKLIKV